MNKSLTTSEKSAAKTDLGLTMLQEAFCQMYISKDSEVFGNGVQCYLEIYGGEYLKNTHKIMPYMTAVSSASRLLTNVKIIGRINELLEIGGFTNENVDKQHLFLINQHADLKTKLGAIKEFNSLKGRVNRQTIQPTFVNINVLNNPDVKSKLKDFEDEMIKQEYATTINKT